jgi:hypothetical protein
MEGAGNQCRPRWVVHVVANAKEMSSVLRRIIQKKMLIVVGQFIIIF